MFISSMSETAARTKAAALERLPAAAAAAFLSILPLKLPERLRAALPPDVTLVGDTLETLPIVGDIRLVCIRGPPSLICTAANASFNDAPVKNGLPLKGSASPL